MTHPPSILRLIGENLACRRGERLLFSGLDLSVKPGECLALVGPNGSGKSTLLRILAGLLAPDAGAVSIETTDADETGAANLHYLGHREGLSDALTAAENLAFAAAALGAPGADVGAALARLGIPQVAPLAARLLSAGQRRRLALARLIAAPRPLWLLDEPLTALDSAGQALVESLLAVHLAAGGLAVVATHHPIGGTTHRLTVADFSTSFREIAA